MVDKDMIKTIREVHYSKGITSPLTYYKLTYRCVRCDEEWTTVKCTKDETSLCTQPGCNPSFITRLIRALRREEFIDGYGKLIYCEEFQSY